MVVFLFPCQVSESLQVRIVAGRPIHCQVPGIDHHLVRWAAVRATLEAAKAIALSHLGTLYIAETDERRINRIQQVTMESFMSLWLILSCCSDEGFRWIIVLY